MFLLGVIHPFFEFTLIKSQIIPLNTPFKSSITLSPWFIVDFILLILSCSCDNSSNLDWMLWVLPLQECLSFF